MASGPSTISATSSVNSEPRDNTPTVPVEPGQRIEHYRVIRTLGRGGFGDVYLADDEQLGRRVVLKILRRPGDDWQQEARTLAQFNHVNIVTVHAGARWQGRAFLVLEYLQGETLRARLDEGPVPPSTVADIARELTGALAYLHHQAVAHRDIKPANLFITRAGRLKILDFGLAQDARTAARRAGTPAYMAPEAGQDDAQATGLDIWALGVTLFELGEGKLPPSPLRFTRTPPHVARVITACLSRAEARPHIDEVARLLARTRSAPPDGDPFRGLGVFDVAHAGWFFGREAEMAALRERLHDASIVAVVGASGVGKSSLVRAGLAAQMAADGWTVDIVRPRADLMDAVLSIDGVHASPPTIAEPVRLGLRTTSTSKRLIIVDQAEEIFTLAGDPKATREALRALLTCARDPIDGVRLVFSLRDDRLGQFVELCTRWDVRPDLFGVTRPDDAALMRTVLEPMRCVDYRVEQTLVDAIITDVHGQPSPLPLLQFCLTTLWHLRDQDRRQLSLDVYAQIGGVAGALARHAASTLRAFAPHEVATVRTVLLALVGTDGLRRVCDRRGLEDLVDGGGGVIDRLIDARLLCAHESEGQTFIEIMHEALFDAWPQLQQWIAATREERVFADELRIAGAQWNARGARDAELWDADALREVRSRMRRLGVTRLVPVAERFLAQGERRAARQRRRRWTNSAFALIALIGIVVVVTTIVNRTAQLERVARSNIGTFELRLDPFDWDPVALKATPPKTPPAYDWTLVDHGGRGIQLTRTELGPLSWQVKAPGTRATLRVHRGRGCAPSLVPIQVLPGFSEGGQALVLRVPTCQASQADAIRVDAGFYLRTGLLAWATPAIMGWLPTFWMDRTEVTNAAYAEFAAMTDVTGEPKPVYPNSVPILADHNEPIMPVTMVNASGADRYCAWLGLSLPSHAQWVKAARGGFMLGAARNPQPARLFPWGPRLAHGRANLQGVVHDPHISIAPASDLVSGGGPYGHLQLVGNVDEWLAESQVSDTQMRPMQGASWDTPVGPAQHHIDARNKRYPRFVSYDLGFRCVRATPQKKGS